MLLVLLSSHTAEANCSHTDDEHQLFQRIDRTFHRGTALTRPRGCRYTIQVGFRTASAEWAGRIAWANHSHEPAWYEFVGRASLRQLLLFGFPPPEHPFWTAESMAEMAMRYPGMDLTRFRP